MKGKRYGTKRHERKETTAMEPGRRYEKASRNRVWGWGFRTGVLFR
jgi:hypothetical protein